MKQCGRCGTQNLDQQLVCSGCGTTLPPAPAAGFGGTMVMSTPEPPKGPEPPKAADPPKPNLRGTMIGLAPPTFVAPGSGTAGGSTPPPAQAQPPAGSASQPPARNFAGTMIGMAPPNFPTPPPPPAPESLQQPSATGGTPRLASAQKTVLGVARPGIAPLNPGQAKAPAPMPVTPAPAAAPAAAPAPAAWPTGPVSQQGPLSPRGPQPRRVSLVATLAIVGSGMLLVAATVAFFMLRGHGSVTARASLDAQGRELLDLSCAECPDGTRTWVDATPVAFKSGKATLRLQAPLKVGENPIVLVLERPGRSREEIALSLPIEFRVRSSTDELAQDSPKVSVLASVLAGTKLEVDGKPVTADPGAAMRFDYEVAADITGPDASVKTLERIVPYKATSAGGASQTGQVEIRIGITPLIVDAPGASIVVGEKQIVIAGRTAPGSVLKVGAETIALDGEGRFVSKQSLALGENSFTVRSTLKDHAPRLIKVGVRRSDNLEREAALARSMAQTSYPEVLRTGDAAVGRSLALDGQLFDLRHDGYSSVLLVDVKNGCKKAPCLAKVIYGIESSIEKGSNLKAFGKVTRFVDGPRTGERIPEVRADLVFVGAK
ncbi:MAG TPA: hypothetical protein VNG33_02385 [Polyangiaceae bacterium]|nr:hypothetical protein [Polyangiaceae bacterium]